MNFQQLRSVRELITGIDNFERVLPCAYDGDSSNELRRFAREGAAEELDLDGTIDATARNAGIDWGTKSSVE